MKKKIFSLLLLLLTISTGSFAFKKAPISWSGEFPYYNNKKTPVWSYFKVDKMSVNQKMSFKISGTCNKPLKLSASIALHKGYQHINRATVPIIRKGNRFYLNYKCLDGPGLYEISFSAAPKRGGKYHWIAETKLFCGLDTAKTDERLFYNKLGTHCPIRSGNRNNYFNIGPIPSRVKNKIRLKITFKKTGKFHFEVIKKEYGYVKRIVHLPIISKRGPQTFDYFFKDGPGTYIISLFHKTENDIRGSLTFRVKATTTLPLTTSSTVLNSELLAFVKKNIGKKVGNGSYEDLYNIYAQGKNTETMNIPRSHKKIFKISPGQKLTASVLKGFYRGDYISKQYGQLIPAKDLIPGDLVLMNKATWSEKITFGKEYLWTTRWVRHGVVIYKKLGGGRFLIAHQNIGGDQLRDYLDMKGIKKVKITGLNVNRLKGKEIKYIRLTRGLIPVK